MQPTISESSVQSAARHLWARRLLLVLAVVLAVVGIGFIPLTEYVIYPGRSLPVTDFEHVAASRAHPLKGGIWMVDVLIGPLRVASATLAWLDPNATILPAAEVVGPSGNQSQLVQAGQAQMLGATETAEVVGLRESGYRIPTSPAPVVVSTEASSPISRVVHPGDAILAVDGTPTDSIGALQAVLAKLAVGQRVSLRISRDGVGIPQPVTTTLIRLPGRASPALGVVVENGLAYRLPFAISIQTGSIGGPSAGLAFTLGLIDTLGNGDLTGGKKVAATGTISLSGAVGPIGGAAQKAVAVYRAGVRIFLVPDANVKAAESKAPPGLRIMGVGTLSQALADLRRIRDSAGG